jgi:hypothetical protein
VLLRYEAGGVGESTVRTAALALAAEAGAGAVWAATCGLPLEAGAGR